jgi:integrase
MARLPGLPPGARHLRRYAEYRVEHLAKLGQPICQRLLLVERLAEPPHIPRDVPIEQLRRLLAEIEREAARPHALCQRMGIMDRAWFLLMLHSVLRSCEVRRLKLADIDWERRLLRIEQSKGLKDRLVPFIPPAAEALRAYLDVRGPAAALPETVFIYRHVPLGRVHCFHRLARYGQRCGVQISPHRLRHSCATLLLNAGAPILTVQAILGHARVDTTLDYARLYDGAIPADYYRAMAQVEDQIKVSEDAAAEPPTHGELLALVDSLRSGTLNDTQTETVQLLRAKLAMLANRAATGSPPVVAPWSEPKAAGA